MLSIVLYRRGSLGAEFCLAGVLADFLYNDTSIGFGAAYNDLFLAYLLIFSASLFGLILALTASDWRSLPSRFSNGLRHRGIGMMLIARVQGRKSLVTALDKDPALLVVFPEMLTSNRKPKYARISHLLLMIALSVGQ